MLNSEASICDQAKLKIDQFVCDQFSLHCDQSVYDQILLNLTNQNVTKPHQKLTVLFVTMQTLIKCDQSICEQTSLNLDILLQLKLVRVRPMKL